jgi:hypothetical protein
VPPTVPSREAFELQHLTLSDAIASLRPKLAAVRVVGIETGQVELKQVQQLALEASEISAILENLAAAIRGLEVKAAPLQTDIPDVLQAPSIPPANEFAGDLASIPVSPEAPYALVNDARTSYWGPFADFATAQRVADLLEHTQGPISTYTLPAPDDGQPVRMGARFSLGI